MQLLYGMRGEKIYILVSIVLVLLFAVLFPHSNIGIHKSLDLLVSDAIANNEINVQLFWEVREFTAPGYIELDKSKQNPDPFLIFTSKAWKSSEILTESLTLSGAIPSLDDDCTKLILSTNTDLICTRQDGSTIIAFVRNQDEMRLANVFFDPKHDKKLVEGKNWFVISYIQ